MTSSAPTLFPSFNARNLSAVDVARTFVPSGNFERLCGQNHSLIVGPRGSGKTTLLKMLQKPALDAWNHPSATQIRSSVGFSGVYIPTDVNWDKQIALLGSRQCDENISEQLSISAFTTHVLCSLVLAMEECCPVPEGPRELERYSEMARVISDGWRIVPRSQSLQSLRYMLRKRLGELHGLANRLRFSSRDQALQLVAQTDWIHLGFLESSSFAIEVVNDYLGEKVKRWAFLFDELELTPKSVRTHLLQSLRSTDERILFKLSLVPFTDEMGKLEDTIRSATTGNDFVTIRLWYPHKEDAADFCEHLWYATLAEMGLEDRSPEEVLGKSYFQSTDDSWSRLESAYGPGSRIANRFASLAKKDATFRRFLSSRSIAPGRMDKLDGKSRPSVVRKIVSLVALRDALLREVNDQGNARLKSKVQPELYTGADSLFAIVEANPRWFKGLIGELLKEHGVGSKISRQSQVSQVAVVARRFRALLKTIPCPPVGSQKSPRGILSTLDQIGDAFHRSQVRGAFDLDPIGSFTVHSRVSDELLESLGKAVNAGALIHMPGNDSVDLLSSLRGKRFRLSYLLAVQYQILLRAERAVSLQSLLERFEDDPYTPLFD